MSEDIEFSKHFNLFSVLDEAIFCLDEDFTIIYWNHFAEKFYGIQSSDAVGQPVTEVIWLYPEAEPWDEIKERTQSLGKWRGESSHLIKDGHRFLVDCSIKQFHLSDVGDWVSIAVVKESINESERQFEKLTQEASTGIFIHEDGVIKFANNKCAEVVGFGPHEVEKFIGTNILSFIHPDDRSLVAKRIAQRLNGGDPPPRYEIRVITQKGETVWVDLLVKLIEQNGKSAIMGHLVDITQQKNAEEALREGKERYRALTENTTDITVIVSSNGYFNYVSPSAINSYGFEIEELIGKKGNNFLHTDDHLKIMAALKKAEISPGTSIPIECFRIRTKQGSWMYLEGLVVCLYDLPSINGIVFNGRDITDKKKADDEKEKLEDQLRQSQKMEAIGRLAGGIAHDFNNILTAINGYSEMVASSLSKTDPHYKDIQEILGAGLRATGLINQLLAFSRKQVIAPRVIQLNLVINHSQKMLKRIIGEDINLVFHSEKKLWRIKADPAQIDQVLINMAVNSRDAMPQGGKLSIVTSNVIMGDKSKDNIGKDQSSEFVLIEFTDNGVGMDEDTLEHIFEPFFSTKKQGEGTGLGLATLYGIVEQNHGFVDVFSKPGSGTTFRLYFPRVKDDIELNPKSQLPSLPNGDETVLLVEDEEMVRDLVTRILEKYGYKVISAQDGLDAYLQNEKIEEKIDLLLTDVVMPNMNGQELWSKISVLRPEIRVLFMSGYSRDVIAKHGILDADTNFIHKPFSMESFVRKVRDVLDG